jgi:Pentapeptide repeats (8 copies)
MRKLILGTGASLLAAGISTSALALPFSDAGKVTLHEDGTSELADKRPGPKERDKHGTGAAAGAGSEIKEGEIKAAAIKHSDIKIDGVLSGVNEADFKHSDLKQADMKHSDIKGAEFKHSDIKGADLKHTDQKAATIKPVEQRIK